MENQKNIKNLQNESKINKISDERMNNKLSLRKQMFSKKLIKERLGTVLFIDYENKTKFFEEDFVNFLNEDNKEQIKESILKMSISELKKLNYNSLELKFWLFSLRKLTLEGNNEKIKNEILDNLNEEKVNFIFQILLDLNNNNEEILKFKYECCSILINLLVDTKDYNNLFIKYSEQIYNFILLLSKQLENEKSNNSELIILFHLIWLFSNSIENSEMFKEIHKNEKIKIPFLIQYLFSLKIFKIYSPVIWILTYFLRNINIDFYIQYKVFLNTLTEILNYSIQNTDIELMNYIFYCFSVFFNSKEICQEILNVDSKVIKIIITFYPSSKYSQKAIIKLVKNDLKREFCNNYNIFSNIILMNLPHQNQINFDNILLKNTIKVLKEYISLPNNEEIINQIMFNKDFLNLLINILLSNTDLKLLCALVKFLICLFQKGNNYIKNDLIKKNIHILPLNELKKYVDLKDKKYNNLIANYLDLIIIIMNYYKEEKEIYFIKEQLEENEICEVLDEFQYSKDKEVYERACYLLQNYWEE